MWKLLFLCLLLLLALSHPGWTKTNQCPSYASSCDECIQAGPHCAWCSQPFSGRPCQTPGALRREGCPQSHIYNPQGEMHEVMNSSSTNARVARSGIIKTQEFVANLRPGVTKSFSLDVGLSADQPVSAFISEIMPEPDGLQIAFSQALGSNIVSVEMTARADHCLQTVSGSGQLQNRTGPWSLYIKRQGSSPSIKLDISVGCQCDCTNYKQEDSPKCSGRGTLVCGKCMCHAPYVGSRCETDIETSLSDDSRCRADANSPVCSNNGVCVDGFCECKLRDNPQERYYGQFCECSNFNCERANNRLCNGHGQCECNQCVCDQDWEGSDCSCYSKPDACMARNQQVCNGRGLCQCGRCICTDQHYFGRTCEICPMCPGPCLLKVECVQCLAFGTGPKKAVCEEQCSHLQVTMVDSLGELTGRHCKMYDHESRCYIYYSLEEEAPDSNNVIVSRHRSCSPN